MGKVVIPGFRKIEVSGGGEGGTTNYNDLTNKPSINNVPLIGNIRTVDLKLTDPTLTEEGVPAEAKTVGTKLEEQSTSLTALSEQLGNHTVKSDVPENAKFTDTVYDDTEVKGSIDELNSNLDTLEFSDVTGGKNIIGCTNVIESSYGTLTKTESGYSVTGVYYGILEFKCEKNTDYFISYEKSGSGTNLVKAINSSRNADIAEFNTNGGTFNSGDNETVYLYLYGGYGTSNTSIYNNFLLCKGTSGTYEPYIPSVKMLAEENSQQSNEIMDIKMLGWSVPSECPIQNYVDSDGVFHQRVGRICLYDCYYNIAGEASNSFYASLEVNNLRFNGELYCNKYKTVSYSDFIGNDKVICVKQYIFIIRDTSCSDITSFKNANKGVYLYYELATPITMTIDGNEAVASLKNDLDRIEGISTTEQIVGTFLGKNLYRNTIVLNFSTPFTVASGNNDTCIDSSGGMVSQASSYEGNIPWGSIDTLVNAESFVETSSYRFTNPFIFKKDKTGYWYCHNVYGETIAATKIVLTLYYTK